MKLRVDKSQIEFYINKLLKSGYHKVSDYRSHKRYEVTLTNGTDTKILSFTQNGWLTIK